MVAPVKDLKHFTIPVFIPGVACPFQCIFCDQKKISGSSGLPSDEMVNEIICRNLETISRENTIIEAGFFGGTFTGLKPELQQRYFDVVRPFIQKGRIDSIRISTRPDFISHEILTFLKKNHVRTIELGAQSMDDEVLMRSSRGHTVRDTITASQMITEAGFSLGLQMMIGLPGDTEEKSIQTAHKIIESGTSETRIYPALVISGTVLGKLYDAGEYNPLELEDAIRWTKNVVTVFESSSIRILRIGLHPSEDLLNQSALVAGPFHPSFRELVMTELWHDRFVSGTFSFSHKNIRIHVNPSDYNNAIGYFGRNRKFFESRYHTVKFIADPDIPLKNYHAHYC